MDQHNALISSFIPPTTKTCVAWSCDEPTRDCRTAHCDEHLPFTHPLPVILPADPVEKNWRDRAVCQDMPQELFFTVDEKGKHVDASVMQACWSCPVRASCLAEGLHELYGVWGGMTAKPRHMLRKRLGIPYTPPSDQRTLR